jgi:hypothetical protein
MSGVAVEQVVETKLLALTNDCKDAARSVCNKRDALFFYTTLQK